MKIAICDDEIIFRDRIVDYLRPYKEKSSEIKVSEFCCGEDLIAKYDQGYKFDLIFLDIEMTGINGVEAGRKIRLIDRDVMLIFVTAYTEYVSDAFNLNAIQFLEKPVCQEKFNKELETAICIYKKKTFKYKINFKNSCSFLEVKDIIFIETYGRHLRAVTITNTYEYLGNISIEESKLSEYGFVRCHKGYLLNMSFINKFDKEKFILTNNKTVPISRYLRCEVLSKLDLYIFGYCV